MVFIGNSSFLVPRMRVYELFPLMVQKAVKILYDNSKALRSPKPGKKLNVLFFYRHNIQKNHVPKSKTSPI